MYYGDEVMVSVFLVANAMDNGNTIDGTEPTENDINSFAQFVTAKNKDKYEEWCLANLVTTGDLFELLYVMFE